MLSQGDFKPVVCGAERRGYLRLYPLRCPSAVLYAEMGNIRTLAFRHYIYYNKAILNTTLLSIGGTQLGDGCYWSSNEANYYLAYYEIFNLSNHGFYAESKEASCNVRAVRAL